MVRETRHWLFDILDKIAVCERLMADVSLEAFEVDVPLRLSVERAIEIISEASRHIADDDKALEPDQPWPKIADIGNRLRHAYHLVPADLIHAVGVGPQARDRAPLFSQEAAIGPLA
jgi:uncharacterized protein with HEPN domain